MTYLECSVHCHTSLSDGAHTPAEMAKAAFESGIKVLGLSDHSYMPDAKFCLSKENTTRYRKEIAVLKEEYAGKMTILCGLEWDQQSEGDISAWDYTIGSVHRIVGPKTGKNYGVDSTKEELHQCLQEFDGDGIAMAKKYYEAVVEVANKAPTVLGHFDLLKKLNGNGEFFDESDLRYRALAMEALKCAFSKVQVLEINTGGLARGYRDEFYPAPFLLEQWRELGGKVIITADAHNSNGLLFAYEQAAEFAKAAGFKHLCVINSLGEMEECTI